MDSYFLFFLLFHFYEMMKRQTDRLSSNVHLDSFATLSDQKFIDHKKKIFIHISIVSESYERIVILLLFAFSFRFECEQHIVSVCARDIFAFVMHCISCIYN